MTDYSKMSIDNLISYRDQWPAQQSEWYRAQIALQKRLAVVDELCRLCGELDAEGLVVVPKESTKEMRDEGWKTGALDKAWRAMISAAPLPASPSSVEG